METGVVSSENFTEQLQGISQKKRGGLLELHFQNSRATIYFSGGKIVEVNINNESPVLTTLNWLQAGGLVSDTLHADKDSTYESLWNSIISDSVGSLLCPLEIYKEVIVSRILDAIYMLPLMSGGHSSFLVQGFDKDARFQPLISVSQVLLDLDSLRSEEGLYEISAENELVRCNDIPDDSTNDEKAILRCAASPIAFFDLKKMSMLPEYSYRVTLKALGEKGLIKVHNQAEIDTKLNKDIFDHYTRDNKLKISEEDLTRLNAFEIENKLINPLIEHPTEELMPETITDKIDTLFTSQRIVGTLILLYAFVAFFAPFLFWQRMLELF